MNDLKINPTDEQKEMTLKFADECKQLGLDFALKLIDAGMKCDGAGSMVAHAFIQAAWDAARTGVIAEGRDPNPDNFIAAATSHVKTAEINLHWRLVDKPTTPA